MNTKLRSNIELRNRLCLIGMFILCLCVMNSQPIKAQLSLPEAMKQAGASSLEAFRTKNMYLSNYWRYRSYRAGRLPSLWLQSTPIQYRQTFSQQFDILNNVYVFRPQQTLYSSGSLQIEQNLDFTGGTFFIDSELSMLRSYGVNEMTQFSSVPIRVGYRQNLFGFNQFKWDRKLEPLLFEKAKKELIHNVEGISSQVLDYFFAVAKAQEEYNICVKNKNNSDTLYLIGSERHKIAAISQADLLTLKLDVINAQNSLTNAIIDLERTTSELATFLNYEKDTRIEVNLPEELFVLEINVEDALSLARSNNPTLIDIQSGIAEAQKEVERTRRESIFNANLSLSMGFNQSAYALGLSYQDLLRQDLAQITLSIPIIDWGVRRGRYNMAKNNLNVVRIAAEQKETTFEQEVRITVNAFNVQQELISSAKEALDVSKLAYKETKERFLIGKTDVNGIGMAQGRQNTAQQNYVKALHNFWTLYYKLRRLCLYDFEKEQTLSINYDQLLNN